jgi:putative DNA methylase
MWLAKASSNDRAIRWVRSPDGHVQTDTLSVTFADGTTRNVRRPKLEVFQPESSADVEEGTVARGSVTCPVTGYTTPVARVRAQLKQRVGGSSDARLLAIREMPPNGGTRTYRAPCPADYKAIESVKLSLDRLAGDHRGKCAMIPDESTPVGGGRGAGRAFSQRNYGMNRFCDMFTPRQQLSLATLCQLIQKAAKPLSATDAGLATAVQTCLGIALARLTDFSSSQAMAEGRRILMPHGVGVIVFAHKSTTGWEAMQGDCTKTHCPTRTSAR